MVLMTMKLVKPIFKRWFDIIILSAAAASICLLFSIYFDLVGIKLTAPLGSFRWPSNLILLAGTMSVLWFINIKLRWDSVV